MRAEGETTVEERPFISSELVVMSIFIFSLFDSSFSLTAQKRPCRIEVSVGAAGLACFPGCGRREEGTGRMMVYLDFICWCTLHGKSYDKSINGSHSNISSKDKDQGVLTWAIERAAQVSKHFEGSISNPSSMLFSKL